MEKILRQILEGQTSLFSEIGKINSEVGKINNEIGKINGQIGKINQRLDDMPTKIDLDKVITEQQKDICYA
jgi:peptidoglycan hydrolase CwlO-like protein